MTTAANKAELAQIDGAGLKRFVVHSALLRLIDPVRGEPTRTLLDENPDDDFSGGLKLKQKFLDSFALICSTSSSGAETASAACLEQHDPAETILRVARNRGFSLKDTAGLEKILQILQAVARKEKSSSEAEFELLCAIAELDKNRIYFLVEKIEKRGIWSFVQEARSTSLRERETHAKVELGTWLDNCPFAAASPQSRNPTTAASMISWASQARWRHSEKLQSLFKLRNVQDPPWLDGLHKIARYHSAIKSMVKLAAKQPEVFKNIYIRELRAPDIRSFSLGKEKTPLLAAVLRLVKGDAEMRMEQLRQHLNAQDVDAKLRKACRLDLTLHAEMQILVFYEANPRLAPQMSFIGTSKKACFLCHEYLLLHPLRLQVSACHQKIYPSWMPPPYYPLSGQDKSRLFLRLGRKLEQLAKHELETALTAPRRPNNQDSTAGPPLTTTASTPTNMTTAPKSRGSSQVQWRKILPTREHGNGKRTFGQKSGGAGSNTEF